MAVARLSQRWVLAVLLCEFPDGVPRPALLDYFAARLVSSRSSQGAKGRLGRRLYKILLGFTQKGLIRQENGSIFPATSLPGPSSPVELPLLDRNLEKLLFLAMMAEDRLSEAGDRTRLHAARQAFILAALEARWDEHQVGKALGLSPGQLRLALAPAP